MLEELKALGRLIKENYRECAVLSLGALFLIIYKKHPLDERWMSHVVYFFALPVVSILALRKNPLDFGLRPGNWRLWLKYVAVAVAIIIPVLLIASHDPSMKKYYAESTESLGHYLVTMALLLFAWEFFFRGFLLFGLKDKFGEAAIFIQMVPFAVMHLGKPEIEALSTVVTGTLFGFIAYRSGSFWPAFIIHLVLNVGNRVIMDFMQ
ncbi:MAG TPA: CPBP family intramembrane metalloprotease [Spirochaetota bacterium]|nr:CPBP family intramembrane metalloprotease [Spirochaetota bacterium]HPI87913.1 CPBP family intramembrane metalloprotease [Spirochaetota bacterium]HPR47355.1 CPBP family intramembrane metalloprotease [Spirochaetota bacterium]